MGNPQSFHTPILQAQGTAQEGFQSCRRTYWGKNRLENANRLREQRNGKISA